MQYISTRQGSQEHSETPTLRSFDQVLVSGTAPDGGLYVPAEWPLLPPGWSEPQPYADLATSVVWPYVEGSPLQRESLQQMVEDAYAGFSHPEVCPLVEIEPGLHVMELFWGPTLAFKDMALQVVGRMFDAELTRRSERATILVATSGDTGAAAIAACAGRASLDVVVLHPAGRVSDVQRRQMTTVDAPNVFNVAVDGTFDDCQDMLKASFADAELRDSCQLAAMNSINWSRVAVQIVYYARAAAAVGPCVVAVPTGNFGNILAGWVAHRGGAPIQKLVIGSNRNDILSRWVTTGALTQEEVTPTLSPAMDIQVSSNHERLLFELSGRDGEVTARWMQQFREAGSVEVPTDPAFVAARLDDDETIAEISDVYERTGYVSDPHTAVGLGAARRIRRDWLEGDDDALAEMPMVCMGTAHPAKFPDAVEKATGTRPEAPEQLAEVFDRPERCDMLPADLGALRTYLLERVAS